ncbi:MAG: phosphoenolpyruvate--protein phosphotransferase [Alphaproteobacteria bacterium]|nr:phosphoenolpyruvate--protein phosphotransferase [Alphaproteobacteria bacterium]
MAGSGSAEVRLNKIVHLIAAELHADVCSCYVMRAGEVLELFATHGLRQEAVHKTRLRSGEGIVGDIAAKMQPLALANAQAHPHFAYRPETGEEPFQSMMGVPILRGGRVRGVLTIQHKERRQYREDEIELLETIGMVVAELIAAGELVSAGEISPAGDPLLLPQRLEGLSLSPGMAAGRAVLHKPQITIREMVSDNADAELTRLHEAIAALLNELDKILGTSSGGIQGESREILETYKVFASDHGWLTKHEDAIKQGLTAEAAVQKVQNDYSARFSQINDPMIKEKAADLDDLATRMLQHLTGRHTTAASTLPEDAILIARTLGPAELLDYDTRKIRGLILESGTSASHVAIVAKALDIPVIGQCGGILSRLEPLDPLIIDGTRGIVYVRPNEDVQEQFVHSMALKQERAFMLNELRDLPGTTRDAVDISLMLNCGLAVDFDHLQPTGADGVGLYRTEIPFMVRGSFPNVEQQAQIYRYAFARTEGKALTIRTLDVGGDKMLPYQTDQGEENPALGWRAIRIGLDRPSMLRQQLRAILEAADGRPFNLMFPMIATIAELIESKKILQLEIDRRTACGKVVPEKLRIGLMMEVPSLIWQVPGLLPHVDFLSIGSNDLLQYFFAADRTNPLVSRRYDPLSPAFLLLIREMAAMCNTAGKSLSVCGEMASRPLEAMTLVGLGVRMLSISPSAFVPIKAMVRSMDVKPLSDYLTTQLLRPDASLRQKLTDFARDHGVLLT